MTDNLEKIIYFLNNSISKDQTSNRNLDHDIDLLNRFAPVLYLHPDEKSWPSSVDWYLERTKLVDCKTKQIIYNPVKDVSKLDDERFKQSPFRLEILDTKSRIGQNPANNRVPIYGTVKTVTTDTNNQYYQLKYYYFFPFNGNIFDLSTTKSVISAEIAAASATLAWGIWSPFTWGIAAVAALAVHQGSVFLSYLKSVDGIGMHEGDWEHISVIVQENSEIKAIYYAAHDGGEWALPSGSTDTYTRTRFSTENGRPVVYIAKESHASYTEAREYPRLIGLANDYTSKGIKWDTQNNIVNMNDGNKNWKDCMIYWGSASKNPIPNSFLFKSLINQNEYNGGPYMPRWNELQSGSDLYVLNDPELSDSHGWGDPKYYRTIQCADIDGDGREELIARSMYGIWVWKCNTSTKCWESMPGISELSDSHGWGNPKYYETIQCADIDGDGREELIARSMYGIWIWKYDSNSRTWNSLATLGELSDEHGWDKPRYYETIQCADIDGDGQIEILARGCSGILAWKYNIRTGVWDQLPNGPQLNDTGNWGKECYYKTIQCADIDGDGRAELLARSMYGIWTWKYDPNSRKWNSLATLGELSDEHGWDKPQYYETIQCADIDGDRKAEIIARSMYGIWIWKYNTNSGSWDRMHDGPELSDSHGWASPEYYKTIKCANIIGAANAEIIARNNNGLQAYKHESSTDRWILVSNDDIELSDERGWNKANCYETIQYANVEKDNSCVLIARSKSGILTSWWGSEISK